RCLSPALRFPLEKRHPYALNAAPHAHRVGRLLLSCMGMEHLAKREASSGEKSSGHHGVGQ
ncbi:MAG: hypothetical protein KHX25_09030, partial [Firmicutes bacterium]|nr:hypothetical protein [Bacillota bacterium]